LYEIDPKPGWSVEMPKFSQISIPFRLQSVFCLVAFGFFAAGCSTWTRHEAVAAPHPRLKIALLPVQNGAAIKRLKEIQTVPDHAKEQVNEKERITETMKKVTERMTRSIETRLNESPFFEVVPGERVADALKGHGSALPLAPAQIRTLGRELKVNAVLTIRLSGYGHLKRRWVLSLIATGFVEGIVEGAVVAGATGNGWIGLAVALEEIAQEVLTWGGGAYLFNMRYSPVTIEGELIDAKDGKRLWRHTTFESIDRKGLKKRSEEERKKKEVQLEVTLEKAQSDFVKRLEKAVKKKR